MNAKWQERNADEREIDRIKNWMGATAGCGTGCRTHPESTGGASIRQDVTCMFKCHLSLVTLNNENVPLWRQKSSLLWSSFRFWFRRDSFPAYNTSFEVKLFAANPANVRYVGVIHSRSNLLSKWTRSQVGNYAKSCFFFAWHDKDTIDKGKARITHRQT